MSIMIAETLAEPVAARRSAVRLELTDPALFESTVSSFDGVSQEQLVSFAMHRWPQVRLEPVLIWSGEEMIGACLVMIQRLPLGLAQVAVAKWGPFLRSVDGDALRRYGMMVEGLIGDYAHRRGMMLSLLPLPSLDAGNAEFDFLMRRGFRRGAQMPWNDRYIVRLDPSEQVRRQSLGQTWRRQLGKAEKAGLSFERAAPERLPEFTAIYERMIDRKGFEDRSAYQQTISALMAMQDSALRPELFLVSEGGEVIAGAIIFKAGDRAVYLYGATTERALPLRAGYYLHWRIMAWLTANCPARWYDLGGTDGFSGLHQFKKGMVGETGVIRPVPPTANFATRRLPMLFGEGAFFARDQLARLRARWRKGAQASEERSA